MLSQRSIRIIMLVAAALSFVACNNGEDGPDAPKRLGKPAAAAPANTTTPLTVNSLANSNEDKIVTADATLNDDHVQIVKARQGEPLPAPSAVIPGDASAQVQVANHDANTRECSEGYRDTSAQWTPGLPAAPSATPIFTDLGDIGKSGVRYTDARQDRLFDVALERFKALPTSVQHNSQLFAKQVLDVRVAIDAGGSRAVKVQVTYLHQMTQAKIELRGQLEHSPNVHLVQMPLPGQEQEFAGELTCTDLDHGCKNVILHLDQVTLKSNKILRSVFMVHRWGDAHITMSETERKSFARLPNQNESVFAEYLSNTLNNTCLNILSEVSTGHRQLPACAIEHLRASCGGEDVRQPSARAFGMRTWSVVGGRGSFELVMSNGVYDGVADYETKSNPYMTIKGPLAFAAVTAPSPMWKHPLLVSGNQKGIENVFLMTNDGGGNLNFQFDFSGTQAAHMRLSVSSLLPDAAYSQLVVQTAQQMPVLQQQDIVSDNASLE